MTGHEDLASIAKMAESPTFQKLYSKSWVLDLSSIMCDKSDRRPAFKNVILYIVPGERQQRRVPCAICKRPVSSPYRTFHHVHVSAAEGCHTLDVSNQDMVCSKECALVSFLTHTDRKAKRRAGSERLMREYHSSPQEVERRARMEAEQQNGWLSPNGDFTYCGPQGHIQCAECIVSSSASMGEKHSANPERALEEYGYIKVSDGKWIQPPHRNALPQPQIDFIFDWCQRHNKEYPDWYKRALSEDA